MTAGGELHLTARIVLRICDRGVDFERLKLALLCAQDTAINNTNKTSARINRAHLVFAILPVPSSTLVVEKS